MIDTNTAIAILGAASLLASIINMLVAGKINALAMNTLAEAKNAANAAGGALVLARDILQKEKQ